MCRIRKIEKGSSEFLSIYAEYMYSMVEKGLLILILQVYISGTSTQCVPQNICQTLGDYSLAYL
jgi:hypothetical protein